MTITRRIALAVTGLVVLTVLAGAIGLGAQLWMKTWSSDYKDSAARVREASRISAGSASMVTYGLAEVSTTYELNRTQFEALWQENSAQVSEALASLSALEGGQAEDSAELTEMTDLFGRCSKALLSATQLSATDQEAALADMNKAVLPLARQLVLASSDYLSSKQAQEQASLDAMNRRVSLLMIGTAIILGLAVIAGVALALRLTRRINRQLGEAIGSMKTSAGQLLAVASQVAASAAQTASATNETTATVEEVKQTAQLAHEKASQVADSSQNVADAAGAERATVEETMAAFERIQSQMAVVTETINRLSDQTQAVGDIINTVNDIAEQSNLLSVNASIEAAKAGDQGKGFTVVAQEVKSLAEQSKQAVSQVRSILSEIQKASASAVQAAEQGREAIEAGRRQSLESGEAIQALTASAGETAQSAVQISASSRQQLAGMEQISQAIESINQAGTQAAAGTRQVEEEVQRLQDLAENLRRLVNARATA